MLRLFNIRALLFATLLFVGCDSAVISGSEVQDIAEVQWRRGSDALVGFVQYFVATVNVPDPGIAYKLTKIDGTGKIGASYYTTFNAVPDFSYTVFVTEDDRYAITQLGNNTYRVDLESGTEKKLLGDFHLMASSPDGRFLVGSHSPGLQPIKTVKVYEVGSDTPREITSLEVPGLLSSRGMWLNNGQFAISVTDSVGAHIDICDTLGNVEYRIGDARTAAHNVRFIAATNHLYYRTNAGSIGMFDLDNGMTSQPIHFPVQNFALTEDETDLYFTVRSGEKTFVRKYDLLTGNETQLADDALWGVFLSPDERKLAYIYEKEVNFMEIRVLNLP